MRSVNIVIVMLLLFCFVHAGIAEENQQGERFQKVDDSIVLDTQTGLMWAAQDNGQDIDWYDAQTYFKEFRAGGYTDWRMPNLKELATLFTPGKKNREGYFITDLIKLTECCMWSSYDTMGGSLAFSFKSGKKPAVRISDSYQLRVLPVRNSK